MTDTGIQAAFGAASILTQLLASANGMLTLTLLHATRWYPFCDGPAGTGCYVLEWPCLVQLDEGDTIVSSINGQFVWFDKVGSTYVPRHNAETTYELDHDAGAEEFVLTVRRDSSLSIYRFHDFTQTTYPQGRLKEFIPPSEIPITVESYSGCSIAEVRQSVTENGDTTDESILVDSNAINTATLRRRVNGGAWTTIRKATLSYYGAGDANGSPGALKLAVIEEPDASLSPPWRCVGRSYSAHTRLARPRDMTARSSIN